MSGYQPLFVLLFRRTFFTFLQLFGFIQEETICDPSIHSRPWEHHFKHWESSNPVNTDPDPGSAFPRPIIIVGDLKITLRTLSLDIDGPTVLGGSSLSITNFIKPYRYPVHMLTVGRLGFMKRTVVGNGSDVGIATFFLYKEWNGATFSSGFISWVYSSYPVRRLTFN